VDGAIAVGKQPFRLGACPATERRVGITAADDIVEAFNQLKWAGGIVWVVTGTNGENVIRAEGAIEAAAWLGEGRAETCLLPTSFLDATSFKRRGCGGILG
jgi:hypothetical protein